MRKCIDSILTQSNIEIIIVNDGSTDDTADIADEYQTRFPLNIKVVHQQNAGHGGAINAGLRNATGVYVKVVDSDDWVDADAFKKVIETLLSFPVYLRPDLFVTNYVYEKAGKRRKTVIRYTKAFPENRAFKWEDSKRFRKGSYLLMHALIYRLDVLKKCALQLPEKMFYVDNYYAYVPLAAVDTMYYLNVNLYRYFIGREGQSIHEQTMIRRIDQQLAVNRLLIEAVRPRNISSDKKRAYLMHHLEIVTTVSSILLMREGSPESMEKKQALWQFIKEKDLAVYNGLRKGLLGRLLHLPTRAGRGTAIFFYKIARMIVGFS
jgi:glycosyltransferase involved in cell wall biosynthesis